MACVDKMPPVNQDSEMEEGEIVDELDDLSDISSEEEFLLRQRLEVLENYNNVLERTKAKRSSMVSAKPKRDVLCDLSEISATELEDSHAFVNYKHLKIQRHVKPHSKQKKRKDVVQNIDENNVRRKRDHRKKTSRSKKRIGVKVNASSDESEDEYRNKRKKLAEAVIVHRDKSDKSSLSARLHKMIHGSDAHLSTLGHKETNSVLANNNIINMDQFSPVSSVNTDSHMVANEPDGSLKNDKEKCACDPIELSTDDDVKINNKAVCQVEDEHMELLKLGEDSIECQEVQHEKDSEDDLELLRQHALESKPTKPKAPEPDKTEHKLLSEDEDSDTAELRLICLKSALLKKAIEMKQKQKLQKKLSQSSNMADDLFNNQNLFTNKVDSDNNTDIESVDMDMGSDTEEKNKECNVDNDKLNNTELILRLHDSNKNTDLINCAINNFNAVSKEDELDEDEDLLRAKLLTSLSKNLTNLVGPEIFNKVDEIKNIDSTKPQNATKTADVPEAKRFIIKLDESDSEGEHEATKNLTKMHMKLSEQIDFQQKLDLFLKSTRLEVEKTKLPDVVQKPPLPKKPEKFVAKAVNHLPKSEQIEYRNLVRRMAELEKIKQSRQAMINLINQPLPFKDTLKPRNVTVNTQAINNNIDEQIAKSRKKIAEESAKMLKLKEEATKLSQRYKIAATELRNITTAITLNKKQQRAIQNSLSKIRLQHQSLLKSSKTTIHSKVNGHVPHLSHLSNKVLSNKLQKENNPKEEYNNPQVQKAVRVSVVNDFVDDVTLNNPRLSVQVDVANNKKIVKMPKSPVEDRMAEVSNIEEEQSEVDQEADKLIAEDKSDLCFPEVEKGGGNSDAELVAICDHGNKRYYISVDDYKSPLDALGTTTWKADPNAILCPFEVRGQCKDPDCKYLHTSHSEQ